MFLFRLPSSFRGKYGSGSELSNNSSHCLELRNSGNMAGCASWRRAGRGLSSTSQCSRANSQPWLRSRKLRRTSLQRTAFLVMKTWCRWSMMLSSVSSSVSLSRWTPGFEDVFDVGTRQVEEEALSSLPVSLHVSYSSSSSVGIRMNWI